MMKLNDISIIIKQVL